MLLAFLLVAKQGLSRPCWIELSLKHVVRPGFEPGQGEPKSPVLPLHHRTARGSLKSFFG